MYREDDSMEAVNTFGSHQPQLTFRILPGPWLQKDLPIRGTTVLSSPGPYVTDARIREKKKRKRIRRRLPAWALVLGYPVTKSALEQRRIPLTTPLRTRRNVERTKPKPFSPLTPPRVASRLDSIELDRENHRTPKI